MNVLFLTTSYPTPDAPATGIFVEEHARAAAAHAAVAVVHLDRSPDARFPFEIERRDDAFPVWRVRYPYRPLPVSLGCHFAGAVAAYRAVRRAGFEPDLVHAHFFLAAGPASVISLFGRIPFVATEHWTAFLPEDPAELGPVWRAAARASLARAKVVLPVSADLGRAMRAAGIGGEFRVVPNAVDVDLFRPGSGASGRLLTVGLLGPQKGIDVLLQALAQVPSDVGLDIVGDGPSRGEYERLAVRLGLEERVLFHGLLPKTRIAGLARDARLFVLASRFDNNPCALVEAQAAGLPIVSTRVGGIPEIVGDDGVLVPPEDPAAFAQAVQEALADPTRWDAARIAAHARDRYSLEAVGRSLEAVYREALR